MDLRQLRYFVVLATQRSFGRASEVLNIAQPALSRQIRLLEEELGVQLFERHSRGSNPTPEGALLLEGASHLLHAAEQLKSDIADLRGAPKGRVVLGLSPALALLLAAPLLAALRVGYPDIQLRIEEGFSPGLHGQLVQGTVDVCVLPNAGALLDVEADLLLEEDICLIGPATDPALRLDRAPLTILDGRPLILAGLPKSGIRLELELAAARAGVRLDAVLEVGSMSVAKGLVADGVGWAVHLAAAIGEEIAAETLVAVPLEGLKLTRSLAFAVGRPRSRAVQALAATLAEVCRDMAQRGDWPHARMLAEGS